MFIFSYLSKDKSIINVLAYNPASEFDGSLKPAEIRSYCFDSELLEAVEEANMEKRATEKFKGIERHEGKRED